MTELFDVDFHADLSAGEEPLWDELVHGGDLGAVQVRERRSSPRWRIKFPVNRQSDAFATLSSFYRARRGTAEEFYTYTPGMWTQWDDVLVEDLTPGGVSNFNFPGREVETGSDVVTLGGVVQTSGVDYNLGYDGADSLERQRIEFAVAPAAGQEILISYRGRRLLLARFSPGFAAVLGYKSHNVTVEIVGTEV